jgi:putative tricarboxylic transport membrane protein
VDLFSNLLEGFQAALSPQYLLIALLGATLGTFIGVLPGLGPSATISLLLPVVFAVGDPVGAFILFGGIYMGGLYGGSTTAILVNTPGEPSSVVTALDGHQMAKQGLAGPALATAAIGSFVAGTLGTLGLMSIAKPLVDVALEFGPTEYLALLIFALTAVVGLGGRASKAAFSLFLGLVIGTVGIDFESGQSRLTYGIPEFFDGIDFVVAAMGLFAISEVLLALAARKGDPTPAAAETGRLYLNRDEWRRSRGPWLRGSVIGFFVGILPGAGASIASFMSYSVEKMLSKTPWKFGKGAIEGVAGPEAANNASSSGSLVPLLVLGIPGSATTAVMLAAFQGFGIQTGPLLLRDNAYLVWALIASLYIGNVMLIVLNLPLIGLWVRILRTPVELLYPLILVVCILGAYSLNSSVFDLYVLAVFGAIGYILRKADFPLAPLLLGLILEPLIEVQFRRSLSGVAGDWTVFVQSRITLGIYGFILLFLIGTFYLRRLANRSALKTLVEVRADSNADEQADSPNGAVASPDHDLDEENAR